MELQVKGYFVLLLYTFIVYGGYSQLQLSIYMLEVTVYSYCTYLLYVGLQFTATVHIYVKGYFIRLLYIFTVYGVTVYCYCTYAYLLKVTVYSCWIWMCKENLYVLWCLIICLKLRTVLQVCFLTRESGINVSLQTFSLRQTDIANLCHWYIYIYSV